MRTRLAEQAFTEAVLTVDMDAKNELLRQIEEKRTGIADLDRQLQPLRAQEDEIRGKHAPLKEEKVLCLISIH